MAAPSDWGDPTVIPNLIAEHILNSATSVTVDKTYLAEAISEITVETQTLGAALLQLTLIDPAWSIGRSGLCDTDENGLLQQIDINFPEGTDVWWRFAMVDFASADSSSGSPNLTLTFQHRIISYLMNCWGPLGWPHGQVGSTRAQFIKMLADKAAAELPSGDLGLGTSPILFVCPEINEIQPVANSDVYGTEVVTAQSAAAQQAGINKLPSLTAGTKVTIKGSKPSTTQLALINQVMGVAASLDAPKLAVQALLEACIQENTFTNNATGSGTSTGLLQFEASTASSLGINPLNVTQTVTAFLTKAYSRGMDGYKGAIDYATKHPQASADTVAQAAQGSAYPQAYGQWLGEANAIIAAFNGGLSAGVTAEPQSDIAQLTRGTPDNPDEDSWTCMQRLASEVNWFIFSSPSPAPGVWGNYLYYIDGPTCASQKPALYVELSDDGTTWSATDPDTGKTVAVDGVVTNLSGTIDNTAFLFEQTKVIKSQSGSGSKGRVQRQTRIRTPQTPSQMMFNMICGVMQFNAGDVFVFHNAGPANGRWIVEDATCNTLGDLFTQFTLGPPTFAYPEPQSDTVTLTGADGQPVSLSTSTASADAKNGNVSVTGKGTAAGAADVAKQALARQQKLHCFNYSDGGPGDRPIEYAILTQNPITTDCSGFSISCYKLAGLPDPSNNNYDGSGNTASVISNCTRVSIGDAQPGDFIFYGPAAAPLHMNIYIGNGQVVNMGRRGEPAQGDWTQMGPCPPLGSFRSNLLPSAAAQQNPNPIAPKPGSSTNKPTVLSGPLSGVFSSVFNGSR